MKSKIEIVNSWFQDVWVQGDLALVEQLYAPAPAAECLHPEAVRDATELMELATLMRQLVHNKHIRVMKHLEDGEWISLFLEMEGADAATGHPVHMHWQSLMRINNDQIVEHYASVNFMAFFEQLGQLPPDCFELMLAGTALQ